MKQVGDGDGRLGPDKGHVWNWIECLKSRGETRGRRGDWPPFGHHVSLGQHRPLDRATVALGSGAGDIFPDHAEANQFLDRQRRKPYTLPDAV